MKKVTKEAGKIKMGKIVVMDHPLIQHKIGIIRREETGSKDFRTLVSEIAMLMCYEATRDLKLADVEIDTPICKTTVKELKVVPNHIGQSLQPIAIPRHFSFVLSIDTFEVSETLREVFHPIVDLLFCEDPDTIRFGLLVESLAVGVVVRVSER